MLSRSCPHPRSAWATSIRPYSPWTPTNTTALSFVPVADPCPRRTVGAWSDMASPNQSRAMRRSGDPGPPHDAPLRLPLTTGISLVPLSVDRDAWAARSRQPGLRGPAAPRGGVDRRGQGSAGVGSRTRGCAVRQQRPGPGLLRRGQRLAPAVYLAEHVGWAPTEALPAADRYRTIPRCAAAAVV